MIEYFMNRSNIYKSFIKFYESTSVNLEYADEIFNEQEWKYLNLQKGIKRIIEAKKSLYCGKLAIMEFLDIGLSEIKNISLLKGVFGQPVIVTNLYLSINLGISITHTDKTFGILIFDQLHPMGIDIETKTKTDSEFLETYLTECEKKLIKESNGVLSKEIFFSAKESLSKILKTGLTSPLQIYEISKFDIKNNSISLFYENFTQYKSTVELVKDEIRSVTFPVNSKKINY
ncbi:4'-phosphopantetheinyl transferase family protein [Peribacillus butanolivorans]|uniref:4'-phosphopantetheinyl transferase family protein n=1 Tax=Peribacillus butanolivorans TaxID=421767 RepID=UPI00167F5D68|nr:4'-phosphopantetheinyl transferase superfamily protein [Peribacillus butanolivorans]QNU06469.1 4-phosphopantetheinyl transferase family protein [Peribacillus butanolivorans]